MTKDRFREERAAALAQFGVNRRIPGEFDRERAAVCGNGTFVGKGRGGVTVWRGIPFAQSPTGDLRWRAPRPAPESDGVFEAYYNGRSPIQTELPSERASFYPQGEDCLYLNVWADRRTAGQKAVMVFFHGGSYGWGGTADPIYDGFRLVCAHPDVVLITVGYRTGLMGFVDFSDVPGGEEFADAPNLGILDQIEALRWIRKNAAAFGGDPENVTIFGESAGAGSVSLLPVIPAARGLFRRVIAQSGSVALTFSKEECARFTRRLMNEAKAENMADLLSLTEEELKKINEKLNDFNNFPQRDGTLIPFDAYAPWGSEETQKIDLLIGTNADELNYWIGEVGGYLQYSIGIPVKFENDLPKFCPSDRARVERFLKMQKGKRLWRITEFYNEVMFRLPAIRQAECHAGRGGRVYMYYWTHPSAIPLRGACHAVELAYVFGNLDQTIYTGVHGNKRLSDLVMDAWVQFAKTGDPGTPSLSWEPFSVENGRPTMILSAEPHVRRNVLEGQRKLLYPLLRYWLNASYADLSYNVPFVRKAVAAGVLSIAALAMGLRLLRGADEDD
ncbi:MAG: carboxylesterase family protein [Clostridia bacterium]|nr:carboxylesterase family protein [Clostridia bacterium]